MKTKEKIDSLQDQITWLRERVYEDEHKYYALMAHLGLEHVTLPQRIVVKKKED